MQRWSQPKNCEGKLVKKKELNAIAVTEIAEEYRTKIRNKFHISNDELDTVWVKETNDRLSRVLMEARLKSEKLCPKSKAATYQGSKGREDRIRRDEMQIAELRKIIVIDVHKHMIKRLEKI